MNPNEVSGALRHIARSIQNSREPSRSAVRLALIHIASKLDPEAGVRNRGDVVFPAGSKKVEDDEDHFPINSKAQAENALGRANQYDEAPDWYDGSLKDLVETVADKVEDKYPSIEVSEESRKPGKD